MALDQNLILKKAQELMALSSSNTASTKNIVAELAITDPDKFTIVDWCQDLASRGVINGYLDQSTLRNNFVITSINQEL
jgi:hypothetical protein